MYALGELLVVDILGNQILRIESNNVKQKWPIFSEVTRWFIMQRLISYIIHCYWRLMTLSCYTQTHSMNYFCANLKLLINFKNKKKHRREKYWPRTRGAASLTVPSEQTFNFPHFSSNFNHFSSFCSNFPYIYPHFGPPSVADDSSTREGPGYATIQTTVVFCLSTF